MTQFHIPAKQLGTVLVEANSPTDALELARMGKGEFLLDEGSDIELDESEVVEAES